MSFLFLKYSTFMAEIPDSFHMPLDTKPPLTFLLLLQQCFSVSTSENHAEWLVCSRLFWEKLKGEFDLLVDYLRLFGYDLLSPWESLQGSGKSDNCFISFSSQILLLSKPREPGRKKERIHLPLGWKEQQEKDMAGRRDMAENGSIGASALTHTNKPHGIKEGILYPPPPRAARTEITGLLHCQSRIKIWKAVSTL